MCSSVAGRGHMVDQMLPVDSYLILLCWGTLCFGLGMVYYNQTKLGILKNGKGCEPTGRETPKRSFNGEVGLKLRSISGQLLQLLAQAVHFDFDMISSCVWEVQAL